jgi:N-acetylornithine carbamoyltransferase
MSHWLDGTEAGAAGLRALVERALALRAGAAPRRFPGARVGAVFLNPSLRTRASLEAACALLGAHPIVLSPGQDAWGWEFRDGVRMDGASPEHVREAVPVLGSYVDVLAVRSFAKLADPAEDRADGVLASFVALAGRPVTNLESARWHPLQGLADAATIVSRLQEPRGKRLVLHWAPHVKALPQAVPAQVVLTGAQLGMEVVVAHPEGFELDPEVVARGQALAAETGGTVQIVHDPQQALQGAQVVYAKSWAGWSGYGRREEEALVRASLSSWCLQQTPPGAGFMHCLPVRRGVVVADAVLDGPSSWVQEQAALRLWTAMAVLERQLGGDGWPSA